MKYKKTPPVWKAGDPVALWGDSTNVRSRKEYGRVLRTKWDPKYGWWDVWVNFVGFDKPTAEQLRRRVPYVLRYLETSLSSFVPASSRRRR